MKKTLLITFLLALLNTGSIWAKSGYSPEKKLEHLTKALQLDTAQKSQVASIIKAQSEKMKQLKEENKAAIEAVLSEQQKQKFSEMSEKRQRNKEHKKSRSEQ